MNTNKLVGSLLSVFGCEDAVRDWYYRSVRRSIIRQAQVGSYKAKFLCPVPLIADYIATANGESLALARMLDCVRDGSLVWDVGANMGLWTTFIAQKACHGRVIAFEPIPKTFGLLQGNIKINGLTNIEAYQLALGDKDCSVQMFPGNQDDLTTSSLTKIEGAYGTSKHSVTVAMMTAGTFAAEHSFPDVVKIDVEGAECLVLRGFCDRVWQHLRVLSIEVHPEFIPAVGGSVDEVESLITGHGFSILDRSTRMNTEHWFCVRSQDRTVSQV